jgi:conjugative relaxase-like TrwC/TraI family protein
MVKCYDKFDGVSASKMHRRYYRPDDYYDKNRTVDGIVFGKLSAELGVENGVAINEKQFMALAENRHALTGQELTRARKVTERRDGVKARAARKPFCDTVCSMPKTFSCQGILAGDNRMFDYHKSGVEKVKAEMERIVGCQDNKRTGDEHLERTGNLSGVEYLHTNSRALECQIHSHVITWNVTKSANDKLYCIEFGEFANQSQYLTKVYWDEIARMAISDGLNIVRGEKYGEPQIAELVEMAKGHQQRSDELEIMIDRIEEYAGTKLSKAEISIIVRESRGLDLEEFKAKWELRKEELGDFKKLDEDTAENERLILLKEFTAIVKSCCKSNLKKISTEEMTARQRERVTPEQWDTMKGLKCSVTQKRESPKNLDQSITHAIEHCFQNESVVKIYALYEEIVQHTQGQGVDLAEMRAKVAADPRVVLGKHNEICSREHYRQELECKLCIKEGKGKGVAHRALHTLEGLSDAQRATVKSLLESRDQFTALSGSSGVGKTEFVLAEVIKANVAAGHRVAVVAPSDGARDVLHHDALKVGCTDARSALSNAVSLQMWQADPRLHESLGKGDLLIIDEASFVSLKQGNKELERARASGYRVMLSGDLDQAKSIEAGDFMRLAIGAGIHTAELHEIRRQSETALDGHFRKAIQFFKKGATTRGFQELLSAGCIHEVKGQARIEAMADAIMKAKAEGVEVMCANFTHAENNAIAECVRARMKLGSGQPINVYSTLGWSVAQKKDVSKLRHGMIIEITRGKDKGKAYRIVPHDRGKVAPKGSVYAKSLSRTGPTITLTSANFKMFDVCEEKTIRVAIGEKLFARSAHKKGKLINGEELTVTGWDERFNPIDQNGRVVEHRNLCYAYASTSRKVQGSAATRVITGFDRKSVKAATREVPYVINGRGREDCQIYVESIADLSQIQNRNSERKHATDMPVVSLPTALQEMQNRLEPKVRAELSRNHDGGRIIEQDRDGGREIGMSHDL